VRITFTTAQVSYSTLAVSLPATVKDTHYDILIHCEQHFCQTGSLDAILETNNSVSFTLEGPQSKSKGLWEECYCAHDVTSQAFPNVAENWLA